MGIPDSSLLDLVEKVRSWVSWGGSDPSCLPDQFDMLKNSHPICCNCHRNMNEVFLKCNCKNCGNWFCGKCIEGCDLDNLESEGCVLRKAINSCRFCSNANAKDSDTHDSLRHSPELLSPCFSVESERTCSPLNNESSKSYLQIQDYAYAPQVMIIKSMALTGSPPPQATAYPSVRRNNENGVADSGNQLNSPSSKYYHIGSDTYSSSVRAGNETYDYKSMGSNSVESPSRIDFSYSRVDLPVQWGQEKSPISQCNSSFGQQTKAVLSKPEQGTEDAYNTDYFSDDLSIFWSQNENSQRPLDFQNDLIWFPPSPDNNMMDDTEGSFFAFDDDDDDIGDAGFLFSSSCSLSNGFSVKEKHNVENKEPLKAVIQGHFRALVSQLLHGDDIKISKESSCNDWLDIVASIAWQAANFVRPDTSKGGSMDPGDYVKVKCLASGSPSESTVVKGVVCTKSIKHKRMTSNYKNPRILLLAGALEYEKAHDQLASFNTLLQQENDHMKMIVSKIEALRPNVLLVEKTVASCAQEYLLEKEISLVLNVKRPLLERIARCTGALITPSTDYLSNARLGNCELFRLNRMVEDHETVSQFNKKPSKTLMFFEGCPRRLGCTVLLKGACREELKTIKHVVHYAVFAAYHLSLETSFLADEGATLPKMRSKQSIALSKRGFSESNISILSNTDSSTMCQSDAGEMDRVEELMVLETKIQELGSKSEHLDGLTSPYYASIMAFSVGRELPNACHDDLIGNLAIEEGYLNQLNESDVGPMFPSCRRDWLQSDMQKSMVQEVRQHTETTKLTEDENELSGEYFSPTDGNQSILVYFSSHCVSKGVICEHAKLLRIKFYGSNDKPLGRYLHENLFDQSSQCQSCKERMEAHVLCFMHQQGNLTIKVKHLPSAKLPGERDGKIWMWHRCLVCPHINGVPPATPRVVMSDSAWGLSFGKFLELSFSDHATANRVAPCGHSLQRHCLRFYGFGNMVAFFQYSPIYIFSVHLPPSVLEIGHIQEEWIRKEAKEVLGKMEILYGEILYLLEGMEKSVPLGVGYELSDTSDILNHMAELKDMIKKEKCEYYSLLEQETTETSQPRKIVVDILDLNRVRRSLLIGSHVWDQRLYYLDSSIKNISSSKVKQGDVSSAAFKDFRVDLGCLDYGFDQWPKQNNLQPSNLLEYPESYILRKMDQHLEPCPETCTSCKDSEIILSDTDMEFVVNKTSSDCFSSQESNISEMIDFAWTGNDQSPSKVEPSHVFQADDLQADSTRQSNLMDSPPFRRSPQPVRVHSFNSALRVRERSRKVLPPSLRLSTSRSFHASGDFSNMVRDPVSNLMLSARPLFISSASRVAEGIRLLLPQTRHGHRVIAVYDDDYCSIISYALSSREYEEEVAHKLETNDGNLIMHGRNKQYSAASSFSSSQQSVGLLDLNYIHNGGYGLEDAPQSNVSLLMDPKKSLHFRFSFSDDSMGAGGKVDFSVTCYYAKQFDLLRKLCFPDEVDFIRSLSRCRKWSAQGGKSNVYFAKSLDDRFIIKQVIKTELDSFEETAPHYFKYLMDSINSGSPTCLAKILGIYQVIVKYPKGGKETKIDVMVMENIFYKRNISRVYDLKGSRRSRYNPETSGTMLDMNLLEALRTKPIFLRSKAKRRLERAVWNDTSFLASVDVMDYSLLVGVDDERKELVLGIIDFMRQYTWDKHLETWVKASGILGGPKDASPTVISPKLYKKRFRKAMTTYFLTLPDHWTCS